MRCEQSFSSESDRTAGCPGIRPGRAAQPPYMSEQHEHEGAAEGMPADPSGLNDPYGLFDPGLFVDPYPTYHMLRHAEPVHWTPALQAWVLTRYDHVFKVLSDQRFTSSARRAVAR